MFGKRLSSLCQVAIVAIAKLSLKDQAGIKRIFGEIQYLFNKNPVTCILRGESNLGLP